MDVIAAHAACSAVTVKPLGENRLGSAVVASSSHCRHWVAPLAGQQIQAGEHVESALDDGDAHRLGPEDAGVGRQRIGVCEGRDGGRRCGRVVSVVEPAQAHDAGAHERTVPGGVGVGSGIRVAGLAEAGAGGPVAPGGGAQDRPRLVADVAGALASPTLEAFGDVVEGGRGGEVCAGGRDLGDADGHLRVITPLAGRIGSEAATEHLRLVTRGSAELVGDAQGIATRLAEEHPGGSVGLLAVQDQWITAFGCGTGH